MVILTRIDRPARSTFELFAIVKAIVDEGPVPVWGRGVGRHFDLAVVGGLADVERDLIRMVRLAGVVMQATGKPTQLGNQPWRARSGKCMLRRWSGPAK